MAPPQLHPSAIEQMGVLLVASRRQGLSFEAAWDRAMRPGRRTIMTTSIGPQDVVRWPTDSGRRVVEREVLLATRDTWRRAYEQRPPTSRERALASLLPLLTELVGASDAPDHSRGLSRAA